MTLGLVLLVPNVAFILHGYIWRQSRPTTVSLFFNVVVTLLLVVAINATLRRLRPAWALSRGEVVTIYAMLSVGSAVVGLDQLQTLVPVVAYPVWHATPENDWEALFLQDMPSWLTVTDPDALWAYYDSRGPLLATDYWRPWLTPALIWSGFSFALVFVMLCLNTFFRRNWTDEAKLSYPIIQLPLEMTSPRRSIFADRLFWIGFGIAFAIDALNGLHMLYPSVPSILGERGPRYDLGRMLVSRPWNAIGWTPLNVFPFAVGLAFFIPLDLAFSSWFFYVLWKVLRIVSVTVGWGDLPGAPWINEQSFAAYLALAGFSLWASRRHIAQSVRSVLGDRTMDDSYEPMPYSWAAAGVVGGIALLLVFCLQARMTFWAALGFIVLYLLISVAIARVRAELGSPVHDLHFVGPQVVLTEVLGPAALGKQNLILYAYFYSFNRAHRSHPMPHQVEGMKMASEARISQRGLAAAMMAATGLALLVGWAILLDAFFRHGGDGWASKGRESFSLLEQWLRSPGDPNWYASGALAWGLAFTVFLTWMRTQHVWWVFHPAGFAVSGSWSMALFAPSILVSWLTKSLILRYGGMGAFAPASTFFMGLVLGEFVAGAGWGVSGILMHRAMYNFLP
ncbi:MAG: DUF6785 family protein [Armatimonadota bacterium]